VSILLTFLPPSSYSENLKIMIIACLGDVHGEINQAVILLNRWEAKTKQRIDVVLQVGDFEPHRNEADLVSMACPVKYRKLGGFHEYFNGSKRMPWPLYFIGGNHEPYSYLDTAPEGFTLTENFHYIGRSGIQEINGLRIVGLSGIYSEKYFESNRPSIKDIASVSNRRFTYFNQYDIDVLLEYESCDILLLHDWPTGIIKQRDIEKFKHFNYDFEQDTIGNEYARLLIDALEPKVVICGHMHHAYERLISHASGQETKVHCLTSITQKESAYVMLENIGDDIISIT